jgi:hypothetical protein
MAFTKLDSGIVNSSIWSEPAATRVLWITMLAMSDDTGFVATSAPGLIRAANITKEDFVVGIKSLESEDEHSRTIEYGGRRIDRVEGGWIILNYMKYREKEDKDKHREYMREYRRKACNSQDVTVIHSNSQSVTVESRSASASASASKSPFKKKELIKPTIQEVEKYCNERGNKIDPQKFFSYYEEKGWKSNDGNTINWKLKIIYWESNERKDDGKSGGFNF